MKSPYPGAAAQILEELISQIGRYAMGRCTFAAGTSLWRASMKAGGALLHGLPPSTLPSRG